MLPILRGVLRSKLTVDSVSALKANFWPVPNIKGEIKL